MASFLGILTRMNRYGYLRAIEIDLRALGTTWTASRPNKRRTVMARRFLFLGIGVLALMGLLGSPGQVQAHHSRGSFRPGFQPGFNPGFRRGFMPGFGFTPRFGFDPRFNGMFF